MQGMSKRARGDAVKPEEEQLELVRDRQPRACDLKETRERGENIKLTISEFSLAFVVPGANPPMVLHFSICDWAAAFKEALLRHGLKESSATTPVKTTLAIGLASWSKNVSTSQVCIALDITQRWILEPYIAEAANLGYFKNKADIMERMLRADAGVSP